MERRFGMFFHLKKGRYDKNNKLTIYLKITVNGLSAEVSTKCKCSPGQWNVLAGRVEGKQDDAKQTNAYLNILQRKVYEIRMQLLDQDKEVSAANIKTLLQGGELTEQKQKYMLMEIFQYHNDQINELVGHEYAPGTLERYQTSYRHTAAFLQWKYQLDDIDIDELDYEFITEYEFWLKSVRRCGHNSTIKYLANFRKIIFRCVRNGWLQKDPFAGFKMTKREVERIALTHTELSLIAAKKFVCERLELVRDIFLFSCYTGLAYIDTKQLHRSDIAIGFDGELWILSKRQKTNVAARIPLLPPALAILDRYAEHPACIRNGNVLPVLSNQKMNAYLKEIADCCGIAKPLTYHIARHTFATTVTLSNGVPIETVSKMLGHRNLKTTQHYARILDSKISDDMRLLKQRFI
ncbi:MAG: site-specific integrase [Bacteroidetes bacterium]|nr:site-specific integrase [Bacteroidota bacterium]